MCMQHPPVVKPQPKKYRSVKKHQALNRDVLEYGDKDFVDERVRKTLPKAKKSFFQKLFS